MHYLLVQLLLCSKTPVLYIKLDIFSNIVIVLRSRLSRAPLLLGQTFIIVKEDAKTVINCFGFIFKEEVL